MEEMLSTGWLKDETMSKPILDLPFGVLEDESVERAEMKAECRKLLISQFLRIETRNE